ncbi:MAG: CUB domain-containing protein [Pseudomonadota bacterium]
MSPTRSSFLTPLSVSGCGGPQRLSGSGSFTSHPQWDGNTEYPSSRCRWVLTAQGADKHVALTFNQFDVEKGDGCTYDWVEVYDGASTTAASLGRFCGRKKPRQLVSSGSQMTVTFTADNSVSKPGFEATFKSVTGGKITIH